MISCSSNDENTIEENILMKEKLIGSWKLVGYYDDMDNDPITGTNYHLVENGGITNFQSNGNLDFPAYPSNPIGSYSVAMDSTLTFNFNEDYTWNPNSVYTYKIFLLTDEYLEFYPFPGEGSTGWLERYQKVEQ